MPQQLLLVGIWTAGTLLGPSGASAEIILDDFKDPVQIVLPEMENQSITTPSVGVLAAKRSIGVSSSQTDPIGLADVGLTNPSNLTVRIDGQFLNHPLNSPLLAFGPFYDFGGPVDLTEDGINDAVFIDMTVFQGSSVPGDLSVLVRDTNGTFAAIVSRFSLLSDSPYTLTMPFSSFGFRGGGGGVADFSSIDLFEVTVRLLQGSTNPETNWFVQMNRVRVGRVVPEPTAIAMALAGVVSRLVSFYGLLRDRTP